MSEQHIDEATARAPVSSLDWEVYNLRPGFRAELFRGRTRLATIRSRWKPLLYVRITLAQWRHGGRW